MQLSEELDDVKKMNQMMLYAKVVTIRDAQVPAAPSPATPPPLPPLPPLPPSPATPPCPPHATRQPSSPCAAPDAPARRRQCTASPDP